MRVSFFGGEEVRKDAGVQGQNDRMPHGPMGDIESPGEIRRVQRQVAKSCKRHCLQWHDGGYRESPQQDWIRDIRSSDILVEYYFVRVDPVMNRVMVGARPVVHHQSAPLLHSLGAKLFYLRKSDFRKLLSFNPFKNFLLKIFFNRKIIWETFSI
jgi:hypothetical protein